MPSKLGSYSFVGDVIRGSVAFALALCARFHAFKQFFVYVFAALRSRIMTSYIFAKLYAVQRFFVYIFAAYAVVLYVTSLRSRTVVFTCWR